MGIEDFDPLTTFTTVKTFSSMWVVNFL